ncbi:hypothetical protein [Nocardioides stalactiti]|nr:hypothetical protein [Nocardioides stalactiti]
MSVMGANSEPRVRELAREAVTLMAFSAAVSVSVALLLLLAYGLGL